MSANKKDGDATGLDLEHELPSAEVEETPAVESELEALRAEKANYLDRLARLQAEFDNFRKRSVRDQQDFRDYALAEALKSLLPILDSLDRALKTPGVSVEDFRSGIELIDKQFHDALSKLGVEPVPAEGDTEASVVEDAATEEHADEADEGAASEQTEAAADEAPAEGAAEDDKA